MQKKSWVMMMWGAMLLIAMASPVSGLNFYDTGQKKGSILLQDGDMTFSIDSDFHFSSGNIGIGTATPSAILHVSGNTHIEGSVTLNGALRYGGSSLPRRSIILTAEGALPALTGGANQAIAESGSHTYIRLDFDDTTEESTFWNWTMPDSYSGGPISVTLFWTGDATVGAVVWNVATTGIAPGESLDSGLTLATPVTDTAESATSNINSAVFADFSPGWTASDYVTFRAFRVASDGGDTMVGDAHLLKIRIEYPVDVDSD